MSSLGLTGQVLVPNAVSMEHNVTVWEKQSGDLRPLYIHESLQHNYC